VEKSNHLSDKAVIELRRRHPHLRDPKYLEFFALKNQSLAVADLLARAASNDACDTAEDYAEKFLICTKGFEAAVSFARVYGLLGGDEARAKSLVIFEHALSNSRVKLSSNQLDYLTFLLIHFGKGDQAKQLSKKPYVLAATSYDLAPAEWFAKFTNLFGAVGGSLQPLEPGQNIFRKLAGNGQNVEVSGDSLVSVIMTTYKPDADAEHAIDSILAQTYTNFELIIVDDGSGPDFRELLESFQAKDSRIRLVLLEKNVGTYGARNAGWLHANGRYLTGQDSDDWAHPMRLELQVRNLDANPQLAGNWCRGIRVNEHLQLDIRDGNFPLRLGERSVAVSMMIRHSPTFLRLGFFDGARKGADTEYLHRLKAVFGAASFAEIPEVLYVIQARYDSLSRTDFAPDWKHPNRQIYATVFGRWHRRLAAGKGGDHFMDLTEGRKFPVPFAFTPAAKRNVTREFDEVFFGDWYSESKRQSWLLGQLKLAVSAGKKVAFAQVDSFYKKFARQGKPSSQLFELYEAGLVDFVALDDRNVIVNRLVTPVEFMYFAEQKPSNLSVKQVALVSFGDSIPEFQELSDALARTVFSEAKVDREKAK
jgi:glycosyltransferase involved in cell wall biosynthesis